MSKKPYTVVAKLEAKSGQEQALLVSLQALIVPTRQEAGCLSYTLHQHAENPALFLFFEEWSDADTFTRHMTSEHVQQWKEAHGHRVNGDLEITVWENRS